MGTLIFIFLIIFIVLPLFGMWISNGELYTDVKKHFETFTWKAIHEDIVKYLDASNVRPVFYYPGLLIGYIIAILIYTLGIIMSGYTYTLIFKPIKWLIFNPKKD